MKFLVTYERTRMEFDQYEVEVEAENAFEADLKVRDGSDLSEMVGLNKPRLLRVRNGPITRRVMTVKESHG